MAGATEIKNLTCCIDTLDSTNVSQLLWKIDFNPGAFIAVNANHKIQTCKFHMIIPKDSLKLILPLIYVYFDSGVNNYSDGTIITTMKGTNATTTQSHSNATVIMLTLENYWEISIPGDATYVYFVYGTNQVYEVQSTATAWSGHIQAWDYRGIKTDIFDVEYFDESEHTQYPYKKILNTPLLQLGTPKKLTPNFILSMTIVRF